MTIKGEGTHTRSQLGRCRGCFHGWVAMSAGGGSACMQALWDVRGRGSKTGALEGLALGERRFAGAGLPFATCASGAWPQTR